MCACNDACEHLKPAREYTFRILVPVAEEEEGFYKLLLHDKNGLVVVREALLVQRLNHREDSSLPNSSSLLSKLQVLRRTATRVRI